MSGGDLSRAFGWLYDETNKTDIVLASLEESPSDGLGAARTEFPQPVLMEEEGAAPAEAAQEATPMDEGLGLQEGGPAVTKQVSGRGPGPRLGGGGGG